MPNSIVTDVPSSNVSSAAATGSARPYFPRSAACSSTVLFSGRLARSAMKLRTLPSSCGISLSSALVQQYSVSEFTVRVCLVNVNAPSEPETLSLVTSSALLSIIYAFTPVCEPLSEAASMGVRFGSVSSSTVSAAPSTSRTPPAITSAFNDLDIICASCAPI